MKPGDFVYIEATTGNGKNEDNEWSRHNITGIYEIAEITDDKIYLLGESLRFPIMKSRITKIDAYKNKPI